VLETADAEAHARKRIALREDANRAPRHYVWIAVASHVIHQGVIFVNGWQGLRADA
jgi:hypothetical protein